MNSKKTCFLHYHHHYVFHNYLVISVKKSPIWVLTAFMHSVGFSCIHSRVKCLVALIFINVITASTVSKNIYTFKL